MICGVNKLIPRIYRWIQNDGKGSIKTFLEINKKKIIYGFTVL